MLRKSLMTLRRFDFVSLLLSWARCSRRCSGSLEGGIEIRRGAIDSGLRFAVRTLATGRCRAHGGGMRGRGGRRSCLASPALRTTVDRSGPKEEPVCGRVRASWPPLLPRSPPATKHPRQTAAACRHAHSTAPRLRPDGSRGVPCAHPRHALSERNIRPAPGMVSDPGGLAVIKSPIGRRARVRGAGPGPEAPRGGRSSRRAQRLQQRAGRDVGKRRRAVSGRDWHGLRGRGGANAAVAGDDLREAWVREKAGANRVMSWCKAAFGRGRDKKATS